MALAVPNKGGVTADAKPTTYSLGTTTTGSLIVVLGSMYDIFAPADGNVTDNKGNSYTLAPNASYPGTGNQAVAIWYSANVTGGASHEVTLTPGGSAFANNVAAMEITGAATTSPMDVNPTGTSGTSTGPTITTGTLAQADEILCGIFSTTSSGSPALGVPSGWTLIAEEENSVHLPYNAAYLIVSSTSTLSPTWSIASSQAWRCALASFKAAAGGGGADLELPLLQPPTNLNVYRM